MKLQNKLRDSVVSALSVIGRDTYTAYEECQNRMNKATTVEEIMEAKKRLLQELTSFLPLGPSSCYFCLLHMDSEGHPNCESCLYAKVHGACYTGTSDYGQIQEACRGLRAALRSYYEGETYPEPVESTKLHKYYVALTGRSKPYGKGYYTMVEASSFEETAKMVNEVFEDGGMVYGSYLELKAGGDEAPLTMIPFPKATP